MNFPVGGSIYGSLKNMKLNIAWQQRKQNPNMPKGLDVDPQIVSLRKQAEAVNKSNIISGIDGKLKAGAEITDDELEYLRVNSPELYKKAIEVRREREQYKKDLAKCRTKEDVERLNARKIQSFLSETNAIRANPNIGQGKKVELMEQVTRKLMGIQSEHRTFVKSKEYRDLPREEDLEKGKKAKKKDIMSIEEDDDQLKELTRKIFDSLSEMSDELAEILDKNEKEDAAVGEKSGQKNVDTLKTSPDSKATASKDFDSTYINKTYNSKGKVSDSARQTYVGTGSAPHSVPTAYSAKALTSDVGTAAPAASSGSPAVAVKISKKA